MHRPSIVQGALLITTVAVASAACAVDAQPPSEETSARSQSITVSPIGTISVPLIPRFIPDPPAARFDVRAPFVGCVPASSDTDLKNEIKAGFVQYFPNVDVQSTCAADNTSHYGVWESTTTAVEENVRVETMASQPSLLQTRVSPLRGVVEGRFLAGA